MIFSETEQGQIYDRLITINQVNFSQGETIQRLTKQRDWALAIALTSIAILIIRMVL